MAPDSLVVSVYAAGAKESGDPPNPCLADPGLRRGLAAPQTATFGSPRFDRATIAAQTPLSVSF